MEAFIRPIAEFAREYEPLIGLLGLVAGAVITGGLGWRWFRWMMSDLEKIESEKSRLEKEKCRLESELGDTKQSLALLEGIIERGRGHLLDSDATIWTRAPVRQPPNYVEKVGRSIPVVVVGNLKGGVGKTTVATNLAVYFERQRGERVLAIDLDYQGSMSSMLLPEDAFRGHHSSERSGGLVGKIIEGAGKPEDLLGETWVMRGSQGKSRVMPCSPIFARIEQDVLVKWLLPASGKSADIRYFLSQFIHSDAVQSSFDRVIIDTPPRVTTGFVNALSSATYLLVPFVLDVLSAERVGLFLRDVSRLRSKVLPALQVVDVVATMKRTASPSLDNAEREAVERVRIDASAAWQGSMVATLLDVYIPRKADIALVAGRSPAYDTNRDVFDPLGDRVAQRAPQSRESARAG